ncbi:helix-turn-helix transcriptional regulator [uncultured Pseudoflavonifractor sp.]|uniref:helix-turn-helix domain-containing protein n=1 Tax=uncultured Pseudoflavonifractor sp. TaxID=1221379 RepID=UPI0025EEE3E8|nr:helix-turn-helix transcriptional regulator [uncultured Pseudoflavonifractor sp.]
MDKKAFGSRLRQARKDRGLTSEKLSELCNINATYLRQIEGGTKVPSLPIFISLCEALDASPNSLLIDSLPGIGLETVNELASLWKAATPSQIKVVTAMLTSALRVLQESQTETT